MSIPVAFALIAVAITAAIEALLVISLLGCTSAMSMIP